MFPPRLPLLLLSLGLILFGETSPSLRADEPPIRIDILVVYTPAVEAFYGSRDGVLAHVLATMDGSNAALANSAIPMVWNLVGVERVEYTESATSLDEDLSELTSPTSAHLNEVHALRDAYGADIVSLFRRGTVNSFVGLAWLLNENNPQSSRGFQVVADVAALSSFTFAHEVGHNLGSQHDRANASGSIGFSTGFGYVFEGTDGRRYRTIMAVDFTSTLIPHFSNPLISVGGAPTGIAAGSPQAADNAHTFRILGPLVADFRMEMPTAPELLGHLPGRTIVAGQRAYLEAPIIGLPPLQFTWFAGPAGDTRQPLAGATGRTLATEPLDTPQTFWVRASNDEGTVASESVRIVPVPKPAGPFTTLIDQPLRNTGILVVDTPSWQDLYFPSGYVETLTLPLARVGSPPPLRIDLRDERGGIIRAFELPTSTFPQAGQVVFVDLPLESFVVPGRRYRLSLYPSGAEGSGDRHAWFGGQNAVNPAEGIGESSRSSQNAFAYSLHASGTEATTFHRWLSETDLTPAQADITADPTGDGLPNLLRYALGGTLAEPASLLRPSLGSLVAGETGPYLPFTFTQRRDMADVALQVEASPDLEAWDPLPSDLIFFLGPQDAETDLFEARVPKNGKAPAFLRLRALHPPGIP